MQGSDHFVLSAALVVTAATPANPCRCHNSLIIQISGVSLPLHEQFQKQTLANAIESATDMAELKGVAALLLDLYFRQKSATNDIVQGKI